MKMGIIAEDTSDVAVIRAITLSLLRPRKIGFKHFVGEGHGRIVNKCDGWAVNLARNGCPWITLVQDLDDYDEKKLRSKLQQEIAKASPKASVVLLPRREIESWLLYDAKAIALGLNESKQPRLPGNPESLSDPKKYLCDLIWKTYGKYYLNTIHNARIAAHIDVARLRKSPSFSPHPPFIDKVRELMR